MHGTWWSVQISNRWSENKSSKLSKQRMLLKINELLSVVRITSLVMDAVFPSAVRWRAIKIAAEEVNLQAYQCISYYIDRKISEKNEYSSFSMDDIIVK